MHQNRSGGNPDGRERSRSRGRGGSGRGVSKSSGSRGAGAARKPLKEVKNKRDAEADSRTQVAPAQQQAAQQLILQQQIWQLPVQQHYQQAQQQPIQPQSVQQQQPVPRFQEPILQRPQVSWQSAFEQPALILNATAPVFEPRSLTGRASQPLLRTYAAVASSATEVGEQSSFVRPRSVQYTFTSPQANESLEISTNRTQINAPQILPATEPELESTRSTSEDIALVTEPEKAEPKDISTTSASQPVEALSAIGEAYLAAQKPTSFRDIIDQTKVIQKFHARRAPDLTDIGPEYSPQPNIASFAKFWCDGRVRPRGFPAIETAPSVEVPALASISKSVRPTATLQSSTSPGSVLPPASTSALVLVPTNAIAGVTPAPHPANLFRVANTTSRSLPRPTAVTSGSPWGVLVFSAPPFIPGQRQPPLDSPTRNSEYRRNLSANQRRPQSGRHRPAQLLSETATGSFSGPSTSIQHLPFTLPKTVLRNAQPSILALPLCRPGDTPEQRVKIKNVLNNMSSFTEVGGLFESIAWNPDQVQANHGESPEILPVPAQPVASYTTVGSLRPATAQQFTAPNRIQRDGAGRRPLQSSFQGRGHDNQFGGRNINQQYNPGHGSSGYSQYEGMNYPQSGTSMQRPYGSMDQSASSMQSTYGSMVQPQRGSTSQSRFNPSAQREAPVASSHETTQQGSFASLARQENQSIYIGSLGQPQSELLRNLQTHIESSSTGLTEDEIKGPRANGLFEATVGSSVPSMHSGNIPQQSRDTLLRHELSLNPQAEPFDVQREHNNTQRKNFIQQQLATNSAPESSNASTHHIATSNETYLSQQSSVTGIASHGQAPNDVNIHGNTGSNSQSRGLLDQNYRFPPPGLVQSTAGNQSSTGNGQQVLSTFGANMQVTTTQRYGDRSGRPQPLTAGPPGERQNLSTGFRGMPSTLTTQLSNSANINNNTYQLAPIGSGMVRDTLPPNEVRQFYPNGFANDITGQYTRLPSLDMSAQEIREANINKSFYSGLQKLNMTTTECIENMAARNAGLNIGRDSQQTPRPNNLVSPELRELQETSEPLEVQQARNPLIVQQINNMDITEVSAQLTGPVFGSILVVADQQPTPNNPARLSRFTPAAPWMVSNSPNGNQSFFGEDFGPTPPRYARDPRHQPQ